ncbi:MAG: heparinase II/III family protein [Puniceicoccales bacterium]|jgi:hypothetical protein|nr:heparinase II/III family protein [Puniceicoccales bacterium]
MNANPLRYLQLVRTFGPRWVLFRAGNALRMRFGLLKRATPMTPWRAVPAAFDDGGDAERRWVAGWREVWEQEGGEQETGSGERGNNDAAGAGAAAKIAAEILDGRFRLFGGEPREIGRLPRWNVSPLGGAAAPEGVHWTRIRPFAHGDIKNIWELSRWPWAWPLALTGGNAAADRFWELADDWLAHNPPNTGVNWFCGQEASLRLFAAVAARLTFDASPATTPLRLARWRQLVRATGARVAANLDYALSQSNNHGVSECCGLLTAGALTGGATGAKWTIIAEHALAAQLASLVYPDGGFAQHSANYHRLLVHDLRWASLVFRLERRSTPPWLADAAARAEDFLDAIDAAGDATGAATGGRSAAFLYGANDGADILPLGAAERILRGSGLKRRSETRAPAARHFPDAGVLVWNGSATAGGDGLRLLLRCPTAFRHRPSHADLLHLAARWRGADVLLSPGSFSYNPPPNDPRAAGGPPLSSAFSHNTVTFEGHDQMEKFSRFLYLPWPTGSAVLRNDKGEPVPAENASRFVASHDAWKRFGARHERFLLPDDVETNASGTDGGFCVADNFFSTTGKHRWRIHWLLADGDAALLPPPPDAPPNEGGSLKLRLASTGALCELHWTFYVISDDHCETAPVATLVRADPHSFRGWHSPLYQTLRPAWSFALELPPVSYSLVQTFFSFTGGDTTGGGD